MSKISQDPDYAGLNENSTDIERLDVVFKVLQKSNGSNWLHYDKLCIEYNNRKIFDAKLQDTGLVIADKSKMNPTYRLNNEGLLFLDNHKSYSNYYKELNKETTFQKSKFEEKENLELQKLRSENMLLTEQLSDFPKIKSERKYLFIVAIIELLVIIIGAISQLTNKS